MVRVRCVLLTVATILHTVCLVYGLGKETNHNSGQWPLLFGAERKSFLDNTSTNGWLKFDDWQCNAPPSGYNMDLRQLVSYYSGDSFGERILVLSRTSRSSRTIGSWSYRFETNSWGIVETEDKSLPPLEDGHSQTSSVLVTVCQSNVLYIAGYNEFNSSVWIFDGHSEIWARKSVVGDAAPIITKNESLLYSVLLDKTTGRSTSCECSHAVVGFSMPMSVVWKLSCSDGNSQRQFVWETMTAGSQAQPSETMSLYPSNVSYPTARAATEEGIILVMADGGLWKYDLYSNQWSILDSFDPRECSIVLRAFFSSKERMYILFSLEYLGNNKIMLYSLAKRAWKFTELFPKSRPFIHFSSTPFSVTTKTSRLLLYTGTNDKCNPSLWELDNGLGLTWNWTKIDSSSSTIVPLFTVGEREDVLAVSQTLVGNILYVVVEKGHRYTRLWSQLQLWELQMNTMAWVLLKVFGYARRIDNLKAAISQRTAVFHGSVVLSFSVFVRDTREVIAYNTKNISWNLDAHLDRKAIMGNLLGRRDFCLAPLNSSALLLYGGRSELYPDRYFCDLWVVMLQSPNNSRLRWFQLQPDCADQKNLSRDSRPRRESLYECVAVNDTLVLIGGTQSKLLIVTLLRGLFCYRDVWYFSLIDHSWEHAFVHSDFNRYSRKTCITSALSIGPQVAVTFQGRDNTPGGLMRRYELWFYVIKTRAWLFHSDYRSMDGFLTFIWNNLIIFLAEDIVGLTYKRLVCPRGYSSRDINRESCALCPKAFFAQGEGETKCTACPAGLMTSSIGSSSLSNCSFCKESFCVYGVCLVLYEKGVPRPFCQCKLGFSGTHCSNPQNILITLGTAAAVALIVFILGYSVRLWKRRKLRERRLLHHVEELTTVWQIGNEEISQLERIGAGGYGEVYRARYRDMTVAMKVLRMPTNDSMMWEFEREIKFMQTVRHPNIVLFLGAGRTRDGSPFIISEFVSRGSLRDVLDDYSQILSTNKKINFSLDVAHGMNFLHSLSPPRVHRDLKSDNLLISETDVVKIADFGLGKQVPVGASNDNHRRGRGRRSILTRRRSFNQTSGARLPLLDLGSQDSPHALGAARWRAPELSVSGSQTQYTTAADVYSFGVVVWEIVTRQLPFEDYRFNYEVLDAVRRGERPALPNNCPAELKTLIQDCWRGEPSERPSFHDIESRLTEMRGSRS